VEKPARESLLAVFLPVLLSQAYTGIVAAFRKAAKDDVVTKMGSRPMYLYRATNDTPPKLVLNDDFGCVIVVHGKFDTKKELRPGAEPTVVAPPREVLESTNEAARIEALQKAGIPIAEIHALYEAAVEHATDQTALRYQSRMLILTKSLGKEGTEARGMVVNISITGAGPKPDEPVLSSTLLSLGDVKPGTFLGPDDLHARSTTWAGGIGVSKESQRAFKTLAGQKVTTFMPVTLTAGLAETRPGSAVAKFIADVLDAAKEDALKLAGEKLIPEKREEAAETHETELEAVRAAEETAYKEYLSALSEQAKKPDPQTSEAARAVLDFEVTRTRRAWCRAHAEAKAVTTVTGDRPHSCP
jgi:hypothetical protein